MGDETRSPSVTVFRVAGGPRKGRLQCNEDYPELHGAGAASISRPAGKLGRFSIRVPMNHSCLSLPFGS
jgi:hypothetical protein